MISPHVEVGNQVMRNHLKVNLLGFRSRLTQKVDGLGLGLPNVECVLGLATSTIFLYSMVGLFVSSGASHQS